jgi:ABC-type nitrate/sulfonate/bicarbonate transport system substrate-binding protein
MTNNPRRDFLRNVGVGASALMLPQFLAACGSSDGDAASSGSAAPPDDGSAATTAASGSVAGSLDTIRQANGWINNVEFGGVWVAIENGYFAEQGIDPTFLEGGPNAPAPPVAVTAGDAQIGQDPSMLRIFQAMAESGDDYVLFGTQFQTSPSGVISTPARPVQTAEDLVGIKFLGQPGAEANVKAALKLGGFDDTDYEFIPAGFTPAPLMEGQGEAYSAFLTNQPLILAEQGFVEGEDYLTATWEQLGLPLYSNVMFGPRSYVEENHDLLVRFMRALILGWEVNEDDPEFAARLSVEKYGVDLGLDINQQIAENETQIPLHRNALTEEKGLFWLDPDRIADEMYPVLEAVGVDPLPALDGLVDLSILEDAYDGKTSMR